MDLEATALAIEARLLPQGFVREPFDSRGIHVEWNWTWRGGEVRRQWRITPMGQLLFNSWLSEPQVMIHRSKYALEDWEAVVATG